MSMFSETMKRLRVCVIGAGAAGLASLRHLVARPESFTAVSYEQTSRIGGTWVYTEKVGKDENGLAIHASMYSDLMTILPKNVMAFPDFPFANELPSFLTHSQILDYLEEYTDHFHLRPLIKFNTCVEKVHLDGSEWNVTTRNVLDKNNTPHTHTFDAVIVCNGHYSVPLIPDIKGLDEFSGRLMHSHDFRHAEPFSGQVVMCLGAGSSGIDISVLLAGVANKVYLSHWGPELGAKFPNNVQQTQALVELRNGRTAILENGDQLEIDALIMCTGYKYDFPFLRDSSHGDATPLEGSVVCVNDARVTPLYKHLLHAEYPRSLSFIGLCQRIAPFPQFHFQVLFALAAIDGSLSLPSTAEMIADSEADYQRRLVVGQPHRYAHDLDNIQWEYNNQLSSAVKCEPLSPLVEILYNETARVRRQDPVNFHSLVLDTLEDVAGSKDD